MRPETPSTPGAAGMMRVSTREFGVGNVEPLRVELANARAEFEHRKQADPALANLQFEVVVRADRGVEYADVRNAFVAAAGAGIAKVDIVALGEK